MIKPFHLGRYFFTTALITFITGIVGSFAGDLGVNRIFQYDWLESGYGVVFGIAFFLPVFLLTWPALATASFALFRKKTRFVLLSGGLTFILTSALGLGIILLSTSSIIVEWHDPILVVVYTMFFFNLIGTLGFNLWIKKQLLMRKPL